MSVNFRSIIGVALSGVVGLSSVLLTSAVMASPANAAPGPRDGSSAEAAAASCWEIKQNNPSSPSGTYWVVTPAMSEPTRVFCDQDMDGGGWALIGRGREGWDLYPQGQGDPAALTQRVRNHRAFSTVQLPGDTIDELLNHQPVRDLDEGFRVLRASDSAGRSYQAMDLRPHRMGRWQWAFHSAEHLSYRFDNGTWRHDGSFGKQFGADGAWHSVNMGFWSNNSYRVGYTYGVGINGGSTSASSFWWQNNSRVFPYAEVYVRPRLLSSDPGFERIPDGGTPAVTRPAVVSDLASRTPWGVVGNLTGSTKEGNSPVQAFAQIGNVMFVGGNFTGVQSGARGQTHPRTALAAFNATTGQWLESFNATFNSQVKALHALPDGNLLVGGDFTVVNGQRHSGTVVLNPTSGKVVPSWDLQIDNRLRKGVVSVRAIVRSGDYLYLGGTFTHLTGQGVKNSYARSVGRVSLTGRPDRGWNPEFNGGVMDLDASTREGRVYAAGFFTRAAKGVHANKAAVISDQRGAPLIPFNFRSSTTHHDYQQAVAHTGSLVFFGGSQHNMFGFQPNTMERVSATITSNDGGDLQAFATDGTVIYGGCHCFGWSYENTASWPDVGTSWTNSYKVQGLGAWSATDGSQIPWVPYRLSSKNAGAWSLYIAKDGALWVGGDFTGSHITPTRRQWNGGFARYPAGDTTAPAAPRNLKASKMDRNSVTLTWSGVGGAQRYQILRDDRPVAATTSTTVTLPRTGAATERLFVRAIDAAGNIGPSTPAYVVHEAPAPEAPPQDTPPPGNPHQGTPQPNDGDTPAPDSPVTLIEDGAQWAYHHDSKAPDTQWLSPDYDDSSWARGAAPLGYGSSQVDTTLSVPQGSQRPITTYFRHSFTVEDPSALTRLVLDYVADDGAVVYLNGHEISRERMSKGKVGHETRANQAVSSATALAQRTHVELSAEHMRPGVNVLTVETHLNYRSGKTLTFQANLRDQR